MFKASTAELAFVLENVAGAFGSGNAGDLSDDTIGAVLDGAAKLALERWARCCQSDANSSPLGMANARASKLQGTSDCHSASAAERRSLKV